MTFERGQDPARRHALLVALGCLGASAVTFVRLRLAGSIRVDEVELPIAVRVALMLAFGACMALAARSYLRACAPRADAASGAAALQRLLWPSVLVHACAAIALPLTSNDVFSNLAIGHLELRGLNPYLHGPSALPAGDAFLAMVGQRWTDVPMPYGPIVAVVNTAAAAAGSVASALVLYKLFLFASSLGVIALAYRFCERRLEGPARAQAFALVALNPLLAWEVSAQAHNDGLMVLALAGFVWAALEERELLAVLLLAAAILTKLAALPILALYLAYVARRAPLKAALLALAAAGLAVLLSFHFWAGPESLRGPLLAAGGSPLKVTRSFAALLDLVAGDENWTLRLLVFRVCWAVGTGTLAFLGLRGLSRATSVQQVLHDSLLIFLAYCLVGAPWFQPWYATWLLPLALVEKDARLRAVVALYTALSVVQYALPIEPVTTVVIDLIALRVLLPFIARRANPLPTPAS